MRGLHSWLARTRDQLSDPLVGRIFFVSVVLLLLGTGFVFSASSARAVRDYGDSYFFVREHFWRVIAALGFCLAISAIDYHHLKRAGKAACALSLVVLVAMLMLPTSVVPEINGARRWLDLQIVPRLQPSEFARLAILLYLAEFLSRKGDSVRDFWNGVLPAMVAGTMVAAVVLAGRDLGTAITLGALVWSMIWLGGARHRHMLAAGAVGLAAAACAIYLSPYRRLRWTAHITGDADPLGAGYHAHQSLIGLAGGGWFGEGIGQSWQKHFFLPEAHTDFVFAIVGEEIGFFGATGVLVLYGWLAWLCLQAARRANDDFGRYLALGAGVSLVLNTLLHAAVVSALIPPTGVPMPLLSYGGSSLIATMISLGMVMSVAARGKVVPVPGKARSG